MKTHHQILFFCLLTFYSCSESKKVSPAEQLKEDVSYLASDELEGRETGTPGERMAGDYVAKRFEEIGLQPKGDSSWFQTFSFKPHPPVQKHGSGDSASLGMAVVKEIIGRSVIGFDDNGKESTIVIGAHLDHLGYGNQFSLHAGDKEIHNGADDNASGVGALLMLAQQLMDEDDQNNYLYIAFSGEENGLWGSNYFTDNPTVELEKVNYMLNMDMVGRLSDEKKLAVYGTGTTPAWNAILETIEVDSISITTTESGVGPSDHTSFYMKDIPVLHFFTGQHSDYHKPSDDFDKINFEGIESVVKYMRTVIDEADDDGQLAFTKTKDEDKDSTPSFKVTLGVMPDYLFDGQGMRIDGVNEGRPAQNAGLQEGDVVIKMGDNEVTSMQDYMKCLSLFEEGETTAVTILRDGEEVVIDVLWD